MSWKKGFRKLPASIRAELDELGESNTKVLAGKRIDLDSVNEGLYEHLGLTAETLGVGREWALFPPISVGVTSKRNLEGYSVRRDDLPKIKKYYSHEIQNFGDGSKYGYSTITREREVFQYDVVNPFEFQIVVSVQEQLEEGLFGVVFSIDETFASVSENFGEDILFAVNLLQENTGVSGVVEAGKTEFSFYTPLDWEVFPPGSVDDILKSFLAGKRPPSEEAIGIIKERLALFEEFKPKEYLRGLGGNDQYIGAKYADDVVVFENIRYGNALYMLYEDWEVLSKKPRSELLRASNKDFDRIVHAKGWEDRFAGLLQKQMEDRGEKLKIGYKRRRRSRRS